MKKNSGEGHSPLPQTPTKLHPLGAFAGFDPSENLLNPALRPMYNIIKVLYNQDSSLFLTHVHIAQTELNSTDLKCNDAVFSSSKSIKHGDKNPRYLLFLKTAL